ncbi:MAG: CoA transferase, partial [Chloroflexota bacterium]|nr:CoA transferase [Chloroflexota bacterium]
MGRKDQPDDALTGVKVLDFTWVATGPLITQYLADHGAQVVKVESFIRPDTGRTSRPFRGGSPGLDRGGMFLCQNSSKLSLALDLGHPQGQALARRLAAWADVVAEAFAPGVMKKWGLTYRELKKSNPSLVYLSTSLQGQTGPHAHQPGYGYHQTALSGFTYFTGRPEGEPQAPAGPYTDYVSPWLGLVAVLAALDGRRRTGRGCYIDLSQFEASLSFLREPLLDYLANGREQLRRGNASRCGAPHGIYRCQGDVPSVDSGQALSPSKDNDRWCAIAVFSQGEWRSFCRVLGNPAWSQEPRFATRKGRMESAQELDRLVEGWTTQRSPEEVMASLQGAGVAAGVVQDCEDLLEKDPQLR